MHTRIKSNHSSQDFHFSLMTLFKSIYWTHLKKPSPRAQPPPTGIFPHRNESKCEKCIFRLWSLWISTINDDFNSLDCKWALCRIHLKKYRSWDGPIQGADRKLSCKLCMKESLANDSCWWSGVKTLVASLRLKQRLWLAESHSSGSSSIWFDSDGSSEFSERGAGGRPPWARPPTCSAAGLSSNSILQKRQ